MTSTDSINIWSHAASNRKGLAKAMAVLFISVGLGVALPLSIDWAAANLAEFQAIAQFLGVHGFKETAVLIPIAMAGVTIACLFFESIVLGYRNSTLFQVIDDTNASVRSDLFYFFIRVSGLASFLALIMTLGTSLHVLFLAEKSFAFQLLAGSHVIAQFAVLVLLITFCNYWLHRLLHSKYFFEIHKVHHSAEFYGVLLPYRGHPLDHFGANIYTAAVTGLLGFEPEVMMAWMVLNAFYQSMVHSNYDWPEIVEPILITPAAHRIHHSNEPRHFNKNLSILTLWDRMFGTYLPPEPVFEFGVENREDFNTGRHLSEVFLCLFRWLGFSGRQSGTSI